MDLRHYGAALLVIGILNWGMRRFGSRQANKLAFLATAAMPVVLSIGLMVYLLVRDGPSTFQSPYFPALLLLVAGATAATAAVALLGQALGRPRPKSPR